jgi:inosine/xanthosine triphosphatase
VVPARRRGVGGHEVKKIIVAVGSLRRPKLDAVREALRVVGPLLDGEAEFEVRGVEVASGVSHTPLTRAEIMAGARQRAEGLAVTARERHEAWQYFVGLEGGLDVVQEGGERRVFLQSWAYASDAAGMGAFGQSGAVEVPEAVVRSAVEQGIELSKVMDTLTGEQGIRDGQGAWGVFTRNVITRQEAFRVAVISAFAPFFNSSAYLSS